ncbi:hypothetical protein Q7P37_008320 [Cladosporium fusiforme]
MPRAKVLDSQRQRAAEACSYCRETKKRCTGTAPCSQCQRRGRSDECFITYLPRGFRSKEKHKAIEAGRQRNNSTSNISAASQRDAVNVRQAPPSDVIDLSRDAIATAMDTFRPLSPTESREENDDSLDCPDLGPSAKELDNGQRATKDSALSALGPRMLLNCHGEKVYVGAAASIAFLQTVRRLVAEQIGPSDFSNSKDSERMLEIEAPKSTVDAMEITVDQKLQFLQAYFSVTEAFIDIFDPPDLEACIMNSGNGPLMLATPESISPGKHFSASQRANLDLVIAIGAQCTSKQDSQNIGRAFFHEAQRQALADMIQDPDLDMVRTFLLMAFYMLGECRRNTAYMYLSVAARAAIALGLHSPSSLSEKRPLDANDKLKLRIWMTCRVGDKLVNSILGRPATTIGIPEQLGPTLNTLVCGSDHNLDCMVASYSIVSVIDDINTKLYSKQDVRPSVVEKLLSSIDSWKRDFSPLLQQSTTDGCITQGETPLGPKKGSVGIVHVSCLYYFAVMLATRPLFISALAPNQRKQNEESSMGEACLEAAMYLAQTCAEALDSALLESNMCIMKALVFAAGLVLGVESFAKPSVNNEVERAFEGAKRVLSFLAIRSPQANHYLDILTSLSNAITEQRCRAEPARASRYVSRLFSFGSSVSTAGTLSDPSKDDMSWTGDLLDEATMAAISNPGVFADSPSKWPNSDQLDPELFIDWETVNISHWDNFPFRV